MNGAPCQDSTAEVCSNECNSSKVGIAEVGSAEESITEVSSAEVSITEVSSAEVSITEVDSAEVGSTEVSSAETTLDEDVGYAEISPAEVWIDIKMLCPPLVPCLHPLFEDVKMFLVCHMVSSSSKVKPFPTKQINICSTK